jgi:hypothetical protein
MKQIGTRGRRKRSDGRVDERKTIACHGMLDRNVKVGEEVEGVGNERRGE